MVPQRRRADRPGNLLEQKESKELLPLLEQAALGLEETSATRGHVANRLLDGLGGDGPGRLLQALQELLPGLLLRRLTFVVGVYLVHFASFLHPHHF